MPELPDVHGFQRYMESTALNQAIKHTRVHDERLLENMSPQQLGRKLKGTALTAARRHGKHLFARCNERGWLVLHFGMTGELDYGCDGAEPEYAQVVFRFDNGCRLAYINRRILGSVGFAEDVVEFVQEQDLGPDALAKSLDQRTFQKMLEDRRGVIKSALMDQSFIAGIGNVYSDEILFQTGLHPKTPVSDLSQKKREELYRVMRRVLNVACERVEHNKRFPRSYLIARREEGAACPRCGAALEKVQAGGRNALYCPSCQPAPKG